MNRRISSRLVVLGVVCVAVLAMVAPVAGTATLSDTDRVVGDSARTDSLQTGSEGFDTRLESGGVFWQGQRLYFNGTAVVEAATEAAVGDTTVSERTFDLRRVDGNDVGSLVTQFVVDREGDAVLNVTSRTGEFVVTYRGSVVSVANGRGTDEGTRASSAVRRAKWDLAAQRLTAEFDDDTVTRGEDTILSLTSNRGRYQLEVSARGLDDRDLRTMFGDQVVSSDSRDDFVVVNATADANLTVTIPSGIDDGTYRLRLAVRDATAGTSVTIEVPGGEPDAEFTTRTRQPPLTSVRSPIENPNTGPTTAEPPTRTPRTTRSPTGGAETTPAESPAGSPADTTTGGPTTDAPTATSTAASPAGTTAGTGPGFGVVVALLALGSVLVVMHHRLR